MNKFPNHIPFDQLVDYVEGRLPLIDRPQLEAHLNACAECSLEMSRLEHLIGLMRTEVGEDAPATLVARVKKLFRSLAPNSSRSRVPAVLRFDSMGLTQAFGVRSGKQAPRQLLFSTGVDEIDLRIEPTGQAWTVSGQVLGKAAAGGMAILHGTAGISQADLNEMSEFILPSVEAGTYKLILNLENLDVEIDELKVGL